MRGINYQSMLKNWDLIIDKLCEEVSTHDVLSVVLQHVNLMADELESKKLNAEKVNKAKKLLEEALSLLNPEG